MARELNLTCINVVNVEDSAVTQVGEEQKVQGERNIGLFMKSGYCYCDIKSFVPQVVCMALVAVWFSDNKTKKTDSNLLHLIYIRSDKEVKRKHYTEPRNALPQNETHLN